MKRYRFNRLTCNPIPIHTQPPQKPSVVRRVTFLDSPGEATGPPLVPVIAPIDLPSPQVQLSEDVVASYVEQVAFFYSGSSAGTLHHIVFGERPIPIELIEG